MGDELPYRLNVVIEKIDDSKKLKTIYAAVITESQSQKGIILGKQGSMIKAIGTAARKELEKEFSKKVNLEQEKDCWQHHLNLKYLVQQQQIHTSMRSSEIRRMVYPAYRSVRDIE